MSTGVRFAFFLIGLAAATNTLGPWNGLAGYTNFLANNQTITYQRPLPTAPEFFRGRVWLQSP